MAADCVCAVVSTQRHAHATLESFLRWHLDGAKFDRVFLYFDHPGDDAKSMAIARSPCWAGRVTVIEATEEFREQERYFELPSWHEVSETVNTMVQTRQRLNCEHCVRRHCVSAGAPVWLLHIDADELFMPPIGESAPDHFRRLDAAGCWQFTYRNLEAVPHTSSESDDYFASVSIFKQHEDELPPDALDAVGTAAHRALQLWLERARVRLGKPAWFLFYSNGKSAVRVDPVEWANLTCAGVHGWVSAPVDCSGSGIADDERAPAPSLWLTNIRKVAQRSTLRTLDATESAVVLHYACCTPQCFAHKNWRALGYLGEGNGSWARRWHEMQQPQQQEEHDGDDDDTDGPQTALLDAEHEALFGLSDRVELHRQLKARVLVRNRRACRLLAPKPDSSAAQAHTLGENAEVPPPVTDDRNGGVSGSGGSGSSSSSSDDEEAMALRAAAYARRDEQCRRKRAEAQAHAAGGLEDEDSNDDEGAREGAPGGGDCAQRSFGKSTEEIESFLLGLMLGAKKKGKGDEGEGVAQPKGAHYQQNLRSW